jgi:hypothetical protein
MELQMQVKMRSERGMMRRKLDDGIQVSWPGRRIGDADGSQREQVVGWFARKQVVCLYGEIAERGPEFWNDPCARQPSPLPSFLTTTRLGQTRKPETRHHRK